MSKRLLGFLQPPAKYAPDWLARMFRATDNELSRLTSFAGQVTWNPGSIAGGGGASAGTVTSVDLTAPDIFTVSGNPITTSGTLDFTPTDPGADRIVFWDDSAGKWVYLTAGSGLSITGTTITATSGSGTVTVVSVVTANGVSGSVANDTTTPAITLTLGAITPSSVAASGTVTGSNLSGTNTGDQNLFSTIAVSGQSNVVADATGDTLTLVAGTGIAITTNAGTDAVTITATGSGTVTSVGFTATNDDTVSVSGTPVTTSGTIDSAAVDAGSDKLVGWDDSATKKIYFTLGTGLTTSGTTLNGTAGTVTSVALALASDDTVTVSGSPVTSTGTLTGTAVDAGADKLVGWDDSAGKKIYFALGTGLTSSGTDITTVGAQPYDVVFMLNGAPTASQCLLRHKFARTVVFASGLSPSAGVARTAATAQTDLDIQKNTSSVGTVRWAAAGTAASFIMGSQTTFSAGDIIEVFAPASPDATLANISVTLAGTR